MKKFCIFMFVSGLVTFSMLSQSFASSLPVFLSQEEFLQAEGSICRLATDGCNTMTIIDGKPGIMTQKSCEGVYGFTGQKIWSCLEYELKQAPSLCTFEFEPVCGVDRNTYGNSCEAQLKNVEVGYIGMCEDYIDPVRMKYLEQFTPRFEKIIQPISFEKRAIAMMNINGRVEDIKRSRISRSKQERQITGLRFLHNLLKRTPYQ